jgi:hypothetical protein
MVSLLGTTKGEMSIGLLFTHIDFYFLKQAFKPNRVSLQEFSPTMVQINGTFPYNGYKSGSKGQLLFHCEKFWLNHSNFLTNLTVWWKGSKDIHGTKMYQFQQRLKQV